jgi:hypothetical protein
MPEGVSNVRIYPAEVDYLLEQAVKDNRQVSEQHD